MNTNTADMRIEKVYTYLKKLGSALICCSGGTDSTLLLHIAGQALGDRAHGIFFKSPAIPQSDRVDAVNASKISSMELHVKEVDIFSIPGFANNPEDRCYICKHNIMTLAVAEAVRLGLKHVAEGSHADDALEYRPGRKAIEELGIHSPFAAAGIGKADIREMSRLLGLPTWNKPSFSCLVTRLPHNEPILESNLMRIEKLERFIALLGFREFRLRHRGNTARLEVSPAEIPLLEHHKIEITDVIKASGYTDLEYATR